MNCTVYAKFVLGGQGLLKKHGNSKDKLLSSVVPDYKISRDRWNDLEFCRWYLDKVAAFIGVKHLDDWYHVAQQEVLDRGGFDLIQCILSF
jgi:hypothetical protein